MNEKLKCPNCGKTFVNNPEKHRSRPKYTPCCRVQYNQPSIRLPNLSWIKERIFNLRRRESGWKFKNRGRIERIMMLERQKKENFEEITKEELDRRVDAEYKTYKINKGQIG